MGDVDRELYQDPDAEQAADDARDAAEGNTPEPVYEPMSPEAMRYKDGPSERPLTTGTPDYPTREQWDAHKAAQRAAEKAGESDYRSSITGRYVTEAFAKANPDTTTKETDADAAEGVEP